MSGSVRDERPTAHSDMVDVGCESLLGQWKLYCAAGLISSTKCLECLHLIAEHSGGRAHVMHNVWTVSEYDYFGQTFTRTETKSARLHD